MTERVRAGFSLKNHFHGDYFLVVDHGMPVKGDVIGEVNSLAVQKLGFISLELPHGISPEKAQEVADYLNENIEWVSFTDLDTSAPIGE